MVIFNSMKNSFMLLYIILAIQISQGIVLILLRQKALSTTQLMQQFWQKKVFPELFIASSNLEKLIVGLQNCR